MNAPSHARRVKFRAPGKIVVSGAYSVLWGAPSLVAAVSRGAVADPSREATHVADEVAAALELGLLDRACFVDVSALRAPTEDGGSRKLGLGSSAAIVVATIAALTHDPAEPEAAARARIFELAMRAHKHVQPNGSGIDVAASTHGGVLACRLSRDGAHQLATAAAALPSPVRVVASRTPAITKDMVARVRTYAAASPEAFARTIERAGSAAADAAAATTEARFLDALRAQDEALRALARDSGAPIFAPEMDALARVAERDGAFFGPSGAGGGDVGIHVGGARDGAPWSEAFATALREHGVDAIDLVVGARGVHAEETGP